MSGFGQSEQKGGVNMINKSTFISILAGMMLVTGCQMTDEGQPQIQSLANDSSTKLHPMTRMNQADNASDFGYHRYQREQVENQHFTPSFDRNQLADGVTRIVLNNKAINEAATLVTDKYVLVTYDAQTDNREYVADQVKRSVLSIVPRYYHVYLSDNHDHFQDIERFQHLSPTAPHVEETLKQTITEMQQQSPQGEYNERTDDN